MAKMMKSKSVLVIVDSDNVGAGAETTNVSFKILDRQGEKKVSVKGDPGEMTYKAVADYLPSAEVSTSMKVNGLNKVDKNLSQTGKGAIAKGLLAVAVAIGEVDVEDKPVPTPRKKAPKESNGVEKPEGALIA